MVFFRADKVVVVDRDCNNPSSTDGAFVDDVEIVGRIECRRIGVPVYACVES